MSPPKKAGQHITEENNRVTQPLSSIPFRLRFKKREIASVPSAERERLSSIWRWQAKGAFDSVDASLRKHLLGPG